MIRNILRRLDAKVLAFVKTLPKELRMPMLITTIILHPAALVVYCFLFFAFDEAHSEVSTLGVMIFIGIGILVNTIFKQLFSRKRPNSTYVKDMRMRSASFPSGHAFGGALILGLFAYLVWPVSIVVALALVFLTILVGFSRVYLGAHYASDVLAGWLLGIFFMILLIMLFAL